MPKAIEYNIGDSVMNPHMGEGLILGRHIDPEKGKPVYHVYFSRDEIYRYAFESHIEFIATATDKTIEIAQNLLLVATKNSTASHQYKLGDMVYTPLGNVLLLDNGHEGTRRTGKRIYYHVATDKQEILHYMDSVDIFHITTEATSDSIKRAKRIIMEQILTPAFADDTD